MKKILATLFLIVLALAVLASCTTADGPDTPGDETKDEVNTPNNDDETKAPESPFKTPEKNMRDWGVEYMYEMANIKWSPAQNIDTTSIAKTLYYNKGEVYHGLPYINLLTDSDLQTFTEALKWDETKGYYIYEGATDRNNTLGNDCSSSILLAYKRYDPSIAAYDTGTCFPLGTKSGILPLGNMVIGANDKDTSVITKNTDEQTHFEALALLQKGDTIIWRTDAGHTRMILEVHVERNATGKIHGARSYVKTIEQTNAMDSTRKDGVKTTWWVEHTYTFTKLREKNYIPVTCAAFTRESASPEVTVKNANSQKTIASAKSLLGTLSSDYSILSAEIFIKDKDGNVLYNEYYKVPNKNLTGEFSLKNFKFKFDMSSLATGEYNYSIVAETHCGKGEVYSVDFKKS